MKGGFEDIQRIRDRLILNVSLLTAFNATLQMYVLPCGILHTLHKGKTQLIRASSFSQARTEEKLNTFMAEIRAGIREGSVVSSHSLDSLMSDDKRLGGN